MAERGRYANFSAEEYRKRQQKASVFMESYEMDALFIMQTENINYFTGYNSWLKDSKHRPFVCILPKGEDPVLVLPNLELGSAESFSFVEDIRLWGTDYVDFYVSILKDLKLDQKNIGAELGPDTRLGMPYLEFKKFQERLSTVVWKDCTNLIWDCRMIKSPQEIEYLRRASEITDQAVINAYGALYDGITEREIARIMAATFMEEGADETGFIILRSGLEDNYIRNKYATDRKLRRGELIVCDIGCVYRDYWSDMMRMACIGTPSPQIVEAHHAALTVNTAVREAARPGMTIHELYEVMAKTNEEHGFKASWPGIGHSIGMTGHELPRIAANEFAVFEPGLVFTVEPGVQFPPLFMNIEDVMVITEDGAESLNKCPRELFVQD